MIDVRRTRPKVSQPLSVELRRRVLASLVALLAAGGCAYPKDLLERSHAAMMLQTVREIELDEALTKSLAQLKGGRIVLVQVESARHPDDESANYMIQDALKARLAAGGSRVAVLERDVDVLTLVAQELNELEIIRRDRDEAISVDDAGRRAKVEALLAQMGAALSQNDALVVAGAETRTAPRGAVEGLVSNEIGPNKLALLQQLIREIKELYPTGSAVRSDVLKIEKLKLASATHMLAYRVYDFGVLTAPRHFFSRYTDRWTHIRLFIELVEVASGQVTYAGYHDATVADEILRRHEGAYAKVRPGSFDFGRPNHRPEADQVNRGLFGRLFP